jgi:DNA-binding LacI/PurR family transcriptional regulator
VAGFDNIDMSAYVSPPLTTFHQPKYQLGSEAAKMLLRLLDPAVEPTDEVEPQNLILLGELVVRESTAPPHP